MDSNTSAIKNNPNSQQNQRYKDEETLNMPKAQNSHEFSEANQQAGYRAGAGPTGATAANA